MGSEEFGKYRIERRLAAGGMAELFVGFLQGAKGFERKVAIKRILPHLAADEAFQTMFWDEATLAANLSHPNVVQVLDFGEESGQLFMALEFVDGIDLKSLSKKLLHSGSSLTAAELALIIEGVASGLHHVHTATSQSGELLNIVHRDISPHNVMLSRDGHVKVMDFGVAHAEVRSSKTATGVLKGKLAYMAPEQANDGRLDHRVDQFALGLLIWELAVGEPAYQGPNDAVLLRKVLMRELETLETYRSDLPVALTSLVMKMLELEPEHRYPDMDAVYRAALQCRFALGESGATAHLGSVVARVHERLNPNSKPTLVPEAPAGTSLSHTQTIEETEPSSSARPTALYDPEQHDEVEVLTAMTTLQAADSEEAPTRISNASPASPARSKWSLPKLALPLVLLAFGLVLWVSDWNSQKDPVNVQLKPVESLDQGSKPPKASPSPRDSSASADVGSNVKNEPETLPKSQGPLPVGTGDGSQSAATPQPRSSTPRKAAAAAKRSQKPLNQRSVSSRTSRKASSSGETRRDGTGTLQLRVAEGWYHVLFGSRRLGTTPLGGVSLPVGDHRLVLENPVTGERRTIEVSIKKGKVTKMSVGAAP